MPNKAHSLARQITIFSRRELQELFARAKPVFSHEAFTIRISRATGIIGRMLIITSTKMGNAPERNLIRRRLKAIFYQEKLYLLPYDWIIYCKKTILSLTFSELKVLISKIAHNLH